MKLSKKKIAEISFITSTVLIDVLKNHEESNWFDEPPTEWNEHETRVWDMVSEMGHTVTERILAILIGDKTTL